VDTASEKEGFTGDEKDGQNDPNHPDDRPGPEIRQSKESGFIPSLYPYFQFIGRRRLNWLAKHGHVLS